MKHTVVAALVLLALAGCTTVSAVGRVDAALAEASEARRTGRHEDARVRYEAVLEADPTNVPALRGLVEAHHRLGRLPELEARFTARVAKDEGDAWAHEGLGLIAYALGATEGARARSEFEKAVKLAPEVADFHYRLGVLLIEYDLYADARQELGRAVELDSRRARYRLPFATALARTGDRRAGLDQLAAVLELDPSPDEVALAEKTARQLVDPFRGFPVAAREQYELALGWLQSDATAQAQQALDALLERFPDLAILHATSGLCALKTSDHGRAIAAFRRASELDPDLADPREYLGDLYFGRGRPDAAREEYVAALARNPFLPNARRHLAEVALKEGRKEDAAAAFRSYLLLRPDDFDAQVARATLVADLNSPEAVAAWDGLVARWPRRPEVLIGAGRFWFVHAAKAPTPEERATSKETARMMLEAAVQVDPENAVASEMLAQLALLP